jgi:MoxR-like ATPase
MNPFDAVGTARISAAIYDRVCRVSMDYQSAEDEISIATRSGAEELAAAHPNHVSRVVALVRATRDHPEIRIGSSIRGAVDLLLLSVELGKLRGRSPIDLGVGLDAALTALSGRIRLHDSATRTPEAVITELWRRYLEPKHSELPLEETEEPGPGKAPSRRAADPTSTRS